MTAIVKEEKTMELPAKTYLQTYEEHISGYRQYKLERAAPWRNEVQDGNNPEVGAKAEA